jgi:small subunit ribosomal protein S6
MKKTYELTVIFTPVLKEKGLSSAIGSVESLVKKFKGKVSEVTDQGKQKLAYPIQKYKEGIYVFWKLQMGSENINKFESQLAIQKGILRQLLIVTEG